MTGYNNVLRKYAFLSALKRLGRPSIAYPLAGGVGIAGGLSLANYYDNPETEDVANAIRERLANSKFERPIDLVQVDEALGLLSSLDDNHDLKQKAQKFLDKISDTKNSTL